MLKQVFRWNFLWMVALPTSWIILLLLHEGSGGDRFSYFVSSLSHV